MLSNRALNRTTLTRQLLTRRQALGFTEAVEHLVGLQGQATDAPYIGLWSRLDDFDFDALTAAIERGDLVRGTLLRGTLHLVTATDMARLRPVLQPAILRLFESSHKAGLKGVDRDRALNLSRAMLAEGPQQLGDIAKALSELWPGARRESLSRLFQSVDWLVQAPPSGTWRVTGAPRWRAFERSEEVPAATEADLIVRYLAAFGPASVRDIRAWSGLTGVQDVLARMRGELRTYESEAGERLYDLADAEPADPDTRAPARLVAGFDNLILGYADRSRIMADAHLKRVGTANGIFRPTVLVDGFVRGIWAISWEKSRTVVEISLFEDICRPERAELEGEAMRLLGKIAPDGGQTVRIAAATD